MDINKAKENLKGYLNWIKTNGFSMAENDEAIQIILSELEKKDKIIEDIKFINNNNKPHIAQQKIREYFTNKVEEDK